MSININAAEIRAALALAEAQLEGEQHERKIPGLSAGIVYDQSLIWQRGYGEANLETHTPADERTVYRVASITKLFTATMLMQLRDAGKLSLDDPIETYLPQFKIKSPFRDAKPPTFRMVAAHAAGLPREGNHEGWRTAQMPTIDSLLAGLEGDEMRLPTMTETKYSNLGIAIMGYALSKVAGQRYEDYVAANILQPLGMNDSGFDRSRYDAHYAVGYYRDGETMRMSPHWDEQGFRPAGGMYSTVADISRFIALQFRDQPTNATPVLSSSTVREMQMPVAVTQDFETGFGVGWGVRRLAGCKVIGHSGGLPGYTTNITLAPPLKLAVIVFTNTETEPVLISNKLLEMLIPAFKRQAQHEEVPASAEERAGWKRYTGRYAWFNDVINVEVIDDKLMITSPGAEPSTFIRLLPVDEQRFRMAGGASSGDTVTFELDAQGSVTGLMMGAYPFLRTSQETS